MNRIILALTIVFLNYYLTSAQISGKVFRDFNANGMKDNSASYNEPFVGGVTVIAYPASGSSQTVISNATTGAYSFTGLTLPVRIEFYPALTDDYSGPIGSANSSSVQFYSANTTLADFGISYPSDYCQSNPTLFVPVYINGRENNSEAFFSFPYNSTGNTPVNTTLARSQEIGSTWGVAYDRKNNKIYTSAFLKRHVAMVDNNGDLKEDLGAIYVMSPTGSPALWLDIATLPGVNVGLSLMPTIAQRKLPTNRSLPSHDPQVFDLIGKIGIGDIDISDDFTKLYVVSLFDKKVYTIDIASKTLVGTGVAVPTTQCTGGEVRPFGLKYHRGKIYLGTVCDAQSSQNVANLDANLYRLDGGTFTNILNIPLDYVKGKAIDDVPTSNFWRPWKTTFLPTPDFAPYPTPMFTDIEFDFNEDVILVFNDRYGHQMGTLNYGTDTTDLNTVTGVASGDILKARLISGVYVLENNASLDGGATSTAGAGNGQGPGGGEFYFEEMYDNYHHETVMGGSAFLPGSGEVTVAAYDPFVIFSTGIFWMSNTLGTSVDKYEVNVTGQVTSSFGKTNGLGDIELMCNLAPIQIGNRLWVDSDNDGIQDPSESPLVGVTIQLVNSLGSVIATAVTNSTGNYYFSNATGTSTSSAIYGISGLSENQNYIVRIPNISGASKQAALGTYSLTTQNSGGATDDIRDSDGAVVGTSAEAPVLTTQIPVSGANNHSFDFGFLVLSTCSLTGAGLSNVQCNSNGTPASTTDDYITFSLSPTGSLTGVSYTVTANNGGIVTPSTGTYGTNTNFRLQNGSANGSTVYTLTITDISGAPCQITVNLGPVSPCSSCPNPNCGAVNVIRN